MRQNQSECFSWHGSSWKVSPSGVIGIVYDRGKRSPDKAELPIEQTEKKSLESKSRFRKKKNIPEIEPIVPRRFDSTSFFPFRNFPFSSKSEGKNFLSFCIASVLHLALALTHWNTISGTRKSEISLIFVFCHSACHRSRKKWTSYLPLGFYKVIFFDPLV